MKKRAMLVLVVLIGFLFIVSASPSFEVNNVLLKVSLKEGESISKSFSVTSYEGGEYSLSVNGIGSVSLEETSIILQKGEKKEFLITFDGSGVGSGIYVGNIAVSDGGEEQVIPIVLEVETEDVFFDINLEIPPNYKEIKKGEKLIAQIKVFDLVSSGGEAGGGLGSSSVDLNYYVYNMNGEILSSESENIVVNSQAQATKAISFPKTINSGQYVFGAIVKNKGSVGTASLFFLISDDVKTPLFGESFDFGLAWIIVAFAVFFAGTILLFLYLIRDRDKLMLEMRRYNSQEFKNQRGLLLEQQKVLLKSRNVDVGEVRREVREKVKKIRKKQRVRIKELRKLKKSGSDEQMRKKLAQWKSEGYNVGKMEYKLKGLSTSNMKSILKKWKEEYKR